MARSSLFPQLSCGLLLASVFALDVQADETPAPISGRVETADGIAVAQARVIDAAGGTEQFTDARGRFTVEGCALPCRLTIEHSRFQILESSVDEIPADGAAVIFVPEAKQEVYERIEVTAGRSSSSSFVPETVASTEIRLEDKAYAPSSLTEMVEGVAGVAENGQPGLFQVYSIRGVSRHRVLTLISGMQITSERRAGVATSFIDPLLMGQVDVVRGPASTYYGSGALGGVVQVFPRSFDGLTVESGWNSFGDETYQTVGWGQDGWSIGLARRDMNDDEVSDGSLQSTHFTQFSASVRKVWEQEGKTWELLVMPSSADDIGKPNVDFPDSRITEYPEEDHLLVKVGLQTDGGWTGHVFAHDNRLVTETLRIGSRLNVVENEGLDLGANVQREWSLGSGTALAGIDYFGRRGVTADELETRFGGGEITRLISLDDGSQDEVSAYGSVRLSFGATSLQGGARLTRQEQQNGVQPSRSDSAWTGFVGLARPLGNGVELTANVGSGLRFPNLSERFFTGTTGRGGTIGNPDLEPERSLNVDLGLRWYGDSTFVSAQIFRLEIDDYIERIEVDDDLLTFRNITSGTIDGFELEGFHQLDDLWTLEFSGHMIDGESDTGAPLADVSPDRLQLGLRFDQGDWGGRAQWQYRASKRDVAGGELPVDAAHVVSASLSYDVSSSLTVTLRARNLLDETFVSSTDDKSSAAPGRSVGLGLSWRPGP